MKMNLTNLNFQINFTIFVIVKYFIHGGKYSTPKNNFEEIFKKQNFFKNFFLFF